MPNAKQHAIVGAAVGGGLALLYELSKSVDPNDRRSVWQRVDWGRVAAYAAVGLAIGLLPDILEPATSPNHRKFFHSIAMMGLTGFGSLGEHTERWPAESREKTRICAGAYVSHLLLDAMTRKSLPWI